MKDFMISVVMCTYNGEKYVQAQLDSFSAQTRLPDELVVFDDVSTDQTLSILRSFAERARFNVRIYSNSQNVGSTKNFELGINHARGDIIVLADQDDVWNSEKLRIIEERFRCLPEVGLVFSDADLVDKNLLPLSKKMWESVGFSEKLRRRFITSSAIWKLDFFLKRNVVTGAAMAFDSRYKELIIPIPEFWVHDAWIATLLSSITEFGLIDSSLIKYRQHPQQQIGASRKNLFEKLALVSTNQVCEYERSYKAALSLNDRVNKNLHIFDPNVVRHIKSKLNHSISRLNIVEAKSLSIIILFLREILSLRYYKYSNNLQSVAKDALSAFMLKTSWLYLSSNKHT